MFRTTFAASDRVMHRRPQQILKVCFKLPFLPLFCLNSIVAALWPLLLRLAETIPATIFPSAIYYA